MFKNAVSFNSDISLWDTSSVVKYQSMFHSATAMVESNKPCFVNCPTRLAKVPINNDNIVTARKLWVSDEAACISQYGHISDWDTSQVTSMRSVFSYLRTPFEEDLSKWDASQVTDMKYTFRSASGFNGDISTWDTSKVTGMGSMFYGAIDFNQDLSNWDTSSVVYMNKKLKCPTNNKQ